MNNYLYRRVERGQPLAAEGAAAPWQDRLLLMIVRPAFTLRRAELLETAGSVWNAADLPLSEASERIDEVLIKDVERVDIVGGKWQVESLLWSGLVLTQLYRREAECRMTPIGLEVALYREKHWKYPASLADLPNADELPEDRISGEPFRYRRTEGGFVLWSPGFDGDDDGGVPPGENEELSENGDIVFSVPPME